MRLNVLYEFLCLDTDHEKNTHSSEKIFLPHVIIIIVNIVIVIITIIIITLFIIVVVVMLLSLS